jgi:VIT1/CCC1 family predicted Fe2+/Mn2+ transporter
MLVTKLSVVRGGVEMLLAGSTAATVAYLVGALLRGIST